MDVFSKYYLNDLQFFSSTLLEVVCNERLVNLVPSIAGVAKLFGSRAKFQEKIVLRAEKNNEAKLMLAFAKKRLILHVYLPSHVLKLRSALIKFSTRAAKKSLAGHMRPAGLTLATYVL